MKKLGTALLLLLSVIIYPQPKTPTFLEVREISELGFKWSYTPNSVSWICDFLYSGNDALFISGSYTNEHSPYYTSCVALANFNSSVIWKHDFSTGDLIEASNLSSIVINDETLYNASTPNGLNYYSSSGEIIKTIPQLSGYKSFFPFYENDLVVTLVNAKVYAHKINFQSGALGDSFLVATSVNWIEEAKMFNGNIFLTISKPDGGVIKTLIVKLNENGIIWQTTINKVGPSYLSATPSVIYVVGDSITMNGITSKLIALDSNGSQLWRRSFEFPLYGKMTMSRSVLINPFNNDCIIGGYVADPGGVAYFSSWNDAGELLWEFIDENGLTFFVSKLFWNESNELIVCGEGRKKTDNSLGVLIKKYFIPSITMDVPNETPSPTSFTLEQNYPNPFNPSTTIVFTIPVEARVTLKVYDVLGKEVATLINESNHPVGTHKVSFDGQNLPSGVYFYKLNTPEYSLTKKMVYCK